MPGRSTPPTPLRLPAAMRQQRVDERVLARARAGMDDHARRLVDRQQLPVLEEDLERDRHGLERGAPDRRQPEFQQVARAHVRALRHRLAVARTRPAANARCRATRLCSGKACASTLSARVRRAPGRDGVG